MSRPQYTRERTCREYAVRPALGFPVLGNTAGGRVFPVTRHSVNRKRLLMVLPPGEDRYVPALVHILPTERIESMHSHLIILLGMLGMLIS